MVLLEFARMSRSLAMIAGPVWARCRFCTRVRIRGAGSACKRRGEELNLDRICGTSSICHSPKSLSSSMSPALFSTPSSRSSVSQRRSCFSSFPPDQMFRVAVRACRPAWHQFTEKRSVCANISGARRAAKIRSVSTATAHAPTIEIADPRMTLRPYTSW